MSPQQQKRILITGAAQRVGAAITEHLHSRGMRVAIHYRSSAAAANALAQRLNGIRADSALAVAGDIADIDVIEGVVAEVVDCWGGLDGLVNNASSFSPSPVGEATAKMWEEIMGANLRAPFFLAQAAAPYLALSGGSIVNLIDIYGAQPLARHPIYCASKAGLSMLTKSLALELGPQVRVNGIAPGAILWPKSGGAELAQATIIERTALKRSGDPMDIARTVWFLLAEADYITGQIIAVDGGRSLTI